MLTIQTIVKFHSRPYWVWVFRRIFSIFSHVFEKGPDYFHWPPGLSVTNSQNAFLPKRTPTLSNIDIYRSIMMHVTLFRYFAAEFSSLLLHTAVHWLHSEVSQKWRNIQFALLCWDWKQVCLYQWTTQGTTKRGMRLVWCRMSLSLSPFPPIFLTSSTDHSY